MSNMKQRIERILAEIADAARKSGRNPEDIRLMVVSKTKPLEQLLEAYTCGMRLFGENRVQEVVEKRPATPSDAEIHLIGHLQSNKAADAARYCSCIQTVDSQKLLRRLDRYSGEAGKTLDILLQLKTSEEESKTGIPDADTCLALADGFDQYPALRFRGLMTIAPFTDREDPVRRAFAEVRTLADRLENRGIACPILSMGMSGDFPLAIEEGATLIRVGTAIFGAREYNHG